MHHTLRLKFTSDDQLPNTQSVHNEHLHSHILTPQSRHLSLNSLLLVLQTRDLF